MAKDNTLQKGSLVEYKYPTSERVLKMRVVKVLPNHQPHDESRKREEFVHCVHIGWEHLLDYRTYPSKYCTEVETLERKGIIYYPKYETKVD